MNTHRHTPLESETQRTGRRFGLRITALVIVGLIFGAVNAASASAAEYECSRFAATGNKAGTSMWTWGDFDLWVLEAGGQEFWFESPGAGVRIATGNGANIEYIRKCTIVAEAPTEAAPVEEAPVEEAPVEEAPVEEAPVEEAPAEEAPVEEAPVEEAPADETPDADVPEIKAPLGDVPTEEAPADETPAEQAPEEEAPIESAPEVEAPVDEVPEESAPAEEDPEDGFNDFGTPPEPQTAPEPEPQPEVLPQPQPQPQPEVKTIPFSHGDAEVLGITLARTGSDLTMPLVIAGLALAILGVGLVRVAARTRPLA